MPGGTPTFNTLATAQRGTTVPLLTSGDILVTNLFPGTNVIAGEMHPNTLTGQNEPGISFALTMDAALAPYVPPPQIPDLLVAATAAPTSLPVGSNYTFTIAVTNHGTATANSVQATNILPAGVTVVSLPTGCTNVGGNVVCGIGTLAINAGVTRALTLRPTVAGTLTNRVIVGSTPADYPTNSNHAQAIVVVEAPLAPDIAVTASVSPASIAVNSNYTFTFVVTNLGNSTATTVQSTNALPPGVTVVSLPAGCANVSGSIVCGLGSINAGQAVTRALTLKATDTTPQSKTNIVVVGSTPADASTANNRATNLVSVVSSPDLDIALIGSNLSLSFQSQVGVSYVTEYKNTLTTPAWTPVVTNAGTGGILTYTIPNPGASVPTRFYRVRLQ
jgi:uncharacterized repeat protein (TIGR01451 family)